MSKLLLYQKKTNMTTIQQAEKASIIYFKVILPLKLEWEPYYYYIWHNNDSQPDCPHTDPPVSIGVRVKAMFAGREYTGVISETGVTPEIDPEKIKQIISIEDRLEKISGKEINLWRKVAEYYLCTIGEVYKAAYPAFRTSSEKSRASQEERKAKLLKQELESISQKTDKYKERLKKRQYSLSVARKESVIAKLKEEIAKLEYEIKELEDKTINLTNFKKNDKAAGAPDRIISGINLSKAQQEAADSVKHSFSLHKTTLLKGITGSGKTEIYITLATDILNTGKNILYLVPEIALSKQLEERLSTVFGTRILVFHSGESAAERAGVIERMKKMDKAGISYVVLGTRSSIFLPHSNLGLVIVDEEHDSSYKQDSPAPRYNGRDTAAMLASIHECDLILGSATPSLESLYNCKTGKYALVRLDEKYSGTSESDIMLIDTSKERKKNGMKGSFSFKLIHEINKTLERGEQVMILRSRRSYSPIQQCCECGIIYKCPHCNLPLSYHKASGKDICHYCGFSRAHTGRCTICGGELTGLGTGTQKIEEETAALFPKAKIARLDSDLAQNRKYENEVIRDFSDRKIDILIGTQMVAKGFDFSGLTLVAIIGSDSLLAMQDFRADEKAMQLLEQFRGRCGRRDKKGMFVIQTAQPEHPVYMQVAGITDSLSAEKLLTERKEFGYPPFCRLIDIIIKDRYESRIEKMSRILRTKLSEAGIETTGPYISRNAVPLPSGEEAEKNISEDRTIRLSLQKDKMLTSNKEHIARILAQFEKEMNYKGHISVNVDPS